MRTGPRIQTQRVAKKPDAPPNGVDIGGRHARPPLSLQEFEERLGADLPSIGAAILLAVGVVLCDYGIEGLLDIVLGDNALSAFWCMVMVSD